MAGLQCLSKYTISLTASHLCGVDSITRAQSLAVENGTASHVIKAHKGPIYSLATSGQLLLR